MNFKFTAILLTLFLVSSAIAQEKTRQENQLAKTFLNAKTIVFIGDSITYHGQFLTALESCIIANEKQGPKLLNLGLGSETCSGDSEPAHPWPRPNVHERLKRLLQKIKPDLLVVCYGMNDGIYHPFDETRFENYQAGIDKIIDAASQAENEVKVILVTPLPFDALPGREKNTLAKKDAKEFNWKAVYENYDAEVIAVYAKWILEQEHKVAGCIDMRTPFLEALTEARKTDPTFHFAHDGVHINAAGHKMMGNVIAKAIGLDTSRTLKPDAEKIIAQRQILLRNSWLTEVGHKRPNVKEGHKIEIAAQIEKRLNDQLNKALVEEKTKKESK